MINNPPYAYSSESDLLLDIHIPNIKSDKLPVMVYIHGGSYQIGGPLDYPGNDEFVKQGNVILVVIQYRIGLAGFFSWNEGDSVHANFALYDQIKSLQWINENISLFGGDSNNVTIFGESAGSFSVDQLIRSDLAVPYFHRAIGQSGCLVSTWTCQTERSWEKCQDAYLKHFEVRTVDDLKQKLRNLPYQELLQHEQELRAKGHSYLTRVDKNLITVNFQPHKRPYIIGENHYEKQTTK